MEKILKTAIGRVLSAFVKPSIVFESRPPLGDNTKPVYDEFVRRGYSKKYNLIWRLGYGSYAILRKDGLRFWKSTEKRTLVEWLYTISYKYGTKCTICCNIFLPSSGPDRKTFGRQQKCFYLTHGIPIKNIKGFYSEDEGIDYVISPGSAVNDIFADQFNIDKDKIFVAGYPRNDVFAEPPIDLTAKIGGEYSHVIIWYPTFRQHLSGCAITNGSSMPLIHDDKNAVMLNEVAKECNTLIIFKPHFVQDVSFLHDLQLSNILLIDDSFFEEKGFTSYQMLAASDALITDYSSVYYDYTLHDKPIGVVWEDIDDYRESPGFAVDLDFFMKGAEKIYTIEELCRFVRSVAEGEDRLREKRREIRDLANFPSDGKNTQRVVDFIESKNSF